jgi:NADH-quinone oxidoreductase subunit J
MFDPSGMITTSSILAQQIATPENLPRVPGTYVDGSFSKVMLASIILGAVAYWLMQYGVLRNRILNWVGMSLFGLGSLLAFAAIPENDPSAIIRFCFSILAVAGGLGFIVAREPVHAALGFATAVLSSCGVLFMQEAYFVAAATMIVYAGATIIIFLFVLMFAQQTNLRAYDLKLTRPAFAALIGTALLITITWSVAEEGAILPRKIDVTRINSLANPPQMVAETRTNQDSSEIRDEVPLMAPNQTVGLGRAMYTDYLMSVELAGTILLVATIGAIVLAQKPGEESS